MNVERSEGGAPAPADAPPSSLAASPAWIPAPPPPPPVPAQARRSNRALVRAAVAGALIAGLAIGVAVGLLTRGPSAPARGPSPSSASAGAATVQARALYTQALAAMRNSAGFHYVAGSTGGTATQTIVGDAGRSGGRQVITIDASAGREQFTLVLVSGTVYFEGNTRALEDQLGVPAASASGLQGKWVSVSSQDGPYSLVEPGITVADQAGETALVPTSTTPIRTGGGVTMTRILGTVPPQPQQCTPAGTGHLDVAASSHLPTSDVATLSAGGVTTTTTTTFSGWGTAPAAAAPAGAVAWSTLGASAPPGCGSGGFSPIPSSTPQL